jgi:predicted permease
VTPIIANLALLLAAGWLARRLGLLAEGAEQPLNQFLFYLALPALTIVKIASTPLDGLGWGFVGANTLPLLAVMLAAWGAWRSGLVDWRLGRLLVIVPALGNTAYLGYPVCGLRLGEAAIGQAAIASSIQTVFVFTAGFALMNTICEKACPPAQYLRLLARNAVLWASLAGLGLAWAGLALPPFLHKLLSEVGAATLPLSLFALGAGLYGRSARGNLRRLAAVTGLKLAVMPAAALAVALLAGLRGQPAGVAFLQCCMPAAVMNYVVAREFGFDEQLVGQAVVFSTLAFFPLLYLYDLGLARLLP